MKVIGTILISAIVFLTMNSLIPTAKEAQIYSTTVRLHVLADSDSERDQKLKLKVRDALLEEISNYNAKSKAEALLKMEENKENLTKIAEEVLEKEGCDKDVSIEIGNEKYPTRYYEDFALPAGNYTSVRVIIGSGKGQNWWCVLYPPLCTGNAIEFDDEYCVDVGLTRDQYNLITQASGEYKIKFKLLEMASWAFGFSYD